MQENENEKNESYVLDSFAILALAQKEEGYTIVADLMLRAEHGEALLFLSLINWGEILYILERKHGEMAASEMMQDMDGLPMTLCDVDRPRVEAAAHVKARHPISYADAFATGLAQELGATVVTGDPEFKKVEALINVLWL